MADTFRGGAPHATAPRSLELAYDETLPAAFLFLDRTPACPHGVMSSPPGWKAKPGMPAQLHSVPLTRLARGEPSIPCPLTRLGRGASDLKRDGAEAETPPRCRGDAAEMARAKM